MSIGDFITDSMVLLGQHRYKSAMCLAMNALDATASREYPQLSGPGKVGERIKRFVRDQYDILTTVGFGGAIAAAPGSNLNLPDPEKGAMDSFEGILYKCMRCYLTHETLLPLNAYFNEHCVYGQTSQGFSIPVLMVFAVILAVVGAKTNAHETSQADLRLIVMNQNFPIADYWGRKERLRSLLGIPVGQEDSA
jgi:hypothetical protein